MSVPGILFSVYLILGGIERFLIEIIRIDIKYHFLGLSLTQAQIIAIGMIVTGTSAILLLRNKTKRNLLSK